MSLPAEETIQCPGCGKEFEVTVYQSINDQIPNAAERIITGELFRIKCPHCGHEDHLEYDILFNDFEHRAWIQVVHEAGLIPVHEEMLETMGQYMEGLSMRIVGNVSELRQKVSAFVMGRDDRVIELCKVMCYGSLIRQEPGFQLAWDPVYAADPDVGGEAIVFYGKNGEKKIAPIGNDLVNAMTKLFEEKATEEDKNLYIYDFTWAKEFAARMGE